VNAVSLVKKGNRDKQPNSNQNVDENFSTKGFIPVHWSIFGTEKTVREKVINPKSSWKMLEGSQLHFR
jgi:hypothetical protein